MLNAQGHYWWADNVAWDGVTHWSEYIVYGPRFMGPNAMPIPRLSSGRIKQEHAFSLGLSSHHSEGDKTQNLQMEGTYIIVRDKVSFDFHWVPKEFFQVSPEVKTARKTFHTFYDARTASGDFYLNTNIQLARRERFGLSARLGYKFPTSTMQGAARFTDSPGYYADLSTCVKLNTDDQPTNFNLIGMLGFYAWQTNKDEQFQNDALLAGIGVQRDGTFLDLEAHVRGYWGYLNIGDQPIICELNASHRMKRLGISMILAKGLQDFPFTSFSLLLTRFFDLKDKI